MKVYGIVTSIILAFAILLVGCSNQTDSEKQTKVYNDLSFVGESINWRGKINHKSTEVWTPDETGKLIYKDSSKSEFRLEYKGENKNEVGQIKYSFESNPSTISEEVNLDESGVYLLQWGGGPLKEHHVFKVTVEWNGKKETFDLKVSK